MVNGSFNLPAWREFFAGSKPHFAAPLPPSILIIYLI
jgi:hypothetical protein